ncbi:GNAT family N-acetyltransferase [Prevotella dentasini]|uniref:GNAT family N-acetyltransferase n=1 Tax=Prevotella dentasini TaxID=589537 RepID=UPI00055AA981|nr:GNAT family N-acetyltransferase [Prevotella dentasini]
MKVDIITDGTQLPRLDAFDFFHSRELFWMIEHTPGLAPCMAVVYADDNTVLAHLLAQLRHQRNWITLPLFYHGRIYGEGEYREGLSEEERARLFGLMLGKIKEYFMTKRCLSIEVSDVSRKMFAYSIFRENGFFPVPWMQIHNSLHSRHPKERLSEKALHRIRRAQRGGVQTREAHNDGEIEKFHRLLCHYYRFRKQRYIPDMELMRQIAANPNGHVYVTLFKGHIIGGSVVVDSKGDAMLWYEMARKRSYSFFYPRVITVWNVIEEAYRRGARHIHFLNVGLPYSHNKYQDFLLEFGGKPITSYRWFHIRFSWINRMLAWVYRF